MKLVGLMVAFCLLSSVAVAKKGARHEKNSKPFHTINTFRAKGGNITFTCTPTNCREEKDGSFLFNLSCQTNKEGDKLVVSMGDKSQKIQSYGFVDVAGDIKAPKRGSVPIKISVSEDEDSPQATFRFKYTVEQIKRPTCRMYGELEL